MPAQAAKYKRPYGIYEYGEDIATKAEQYLLQLRTEGIVAGEKLQQIRARSTVFLGRPVNTWNDITAHELIVLLMNTRSKAIYAEKDAVLDGSDWNIDEAQLLAGVAFNTFDTVAYNNGAWEPRDAKDHSNPLPCNLLFISGALTKNGSTRQTRKVCDQHVLTNSENKITIDEEELEQLYEQRLVPGLDTQCALARQNNKKLVINIPGIGTGNFAELKIQVAMVGALARALKKVINNHPEWRESIDTVKLDTFSIDDGYDDFFNDSIDDIKLESIPQWLLLKDEDTNSIRHQLEFPLSVSSREGFNPEKFQLLHVVAWDPFSAPGNDIWNNVRNTDDGVSFASTNALLALPDITEDLKKARYNKTTKIFGDNSQRAQYSINIKSDMVFKKCPDLDKNLSYHYSKTKINTILSTYLNKRTNDHEYHYAGLFSMFSLWSKPLADKKKVIAKLQQALDHKSVTFTPEEISVLRNGNLGRSLRECIKSGGADFLFEGQQQIQTISQFIELLNKKNKSNTDNPSLAC